MISLDKKILDPHSRVARRMIEYGKKDELFIFIPNKEKRGFDLSPTVHIQTSGGMGKMMQMISLLKTVRQTIASLVLRAKESRHNAIVQRITTQDPFFTALAGWLLKKRTGLPLEMQLHGDFFGSAYYRTSGIGNRIRYWLGRFLIHKADRLRVVSERIKQSIEALGVPPDRIEVRPIAVDTEAIRAYMLRFSVKEKYPGYEKYFLYLGRLDPVKNLDWLIDVFADVVKKGHNYILIIVGDGTEKERLADQIRMLKIEQHIHIEPWADDLWSYLKTADCLLFPSLSEGYGLAVMEARAANCPIVMNDAGVANYEVKESDHVRILPINDRTRWQETMISIK